MKKIKKIILLLTLLVPYPIAAQTLEQQLRRAQEEGILPTPSTNIQNNVPGPFPMLIRNESFLDNAPQGIASLITTPSIVQDINIGDSTVFFPRGYGRNTQHFGIWNGIPFVVFNNSTLELRFGMIFEHRQVGFIPDDWISTTLSGTDLPEISFLIPKTKTFLNFARGTSQWRATVLFTDNQIRDLVEYTKDKLVDPNDPYSQIYNVTHRFIDSSTRSYLIGVRHKAFFKALLKVYADIALNADVKTFKGSDGFPTAGFFDDLTLQEITSEVEEIDTQTETIIIDDSEGNEAGDEYVTEYETEYAEEY